MGFDDLFEDSHKHQKHSYDHHYGNNYNNSRSHRSGFDIKHVILEKIQNNPNVKIWIVMALIVIIGLIIIIGIVLFPLILKLFSYISQNGIQGIIDTIWKGAK